MKFELPNVPVKLHLGVSDEERATEQEILVTVAWSCDTAAAEQSDDVADTVDYFAVRERVQNFGDERSWRLVEKFIADLRRDLETTFSRMHAIEISVQKFPGRRWEVLVSK